MVNSLAFVFLLAEPFFGRLKRPEPPKIIFHLLKACAFRQKETFHCFHLVEQ